MKIKIIAVGKTMPAWVNEAYTDYAKRLTHSELKIELFTVKAEKESKNVAIELLMKKEYLRIEEHIQKGDIVIALDEHGKAWNTRQLSAELQAWREASQTLCLVIGGANGLAPELKKRSSQCWSLSPLTLPHPLVRVVLIEQLYRAWTVLINHPYHRA
jgi:23S rRNA (pseudouridine1915-N3)-methyltransferase